MTCSTLQRLVQTLSTSFCFVSNFENRAILGLNDRLTSASRRLDAASQHSCTLNGDCASQVAASEGGHGTSGYSRLSTGACLVERESSDFRLSEEGPRHWIPASAGMTESKTRQFRAPEHRTPLRRPAIAQAPPPHPVRFYPVGHVVPRGEKGDRAMRVRHRMQRRSVRIRTPDAQFLGWRSRPISRVLSWTVIPLGAPSPVRSSNLPGPDAGNVMRSLFGLAPGGVCRAGPLPDSRCALTAPFHPCRPSGEDVGGIFLLHFPSARAAQALPGTLPCGARTFLGIAGCKHPG